MHLLRFALFAYGSHIVALKPDTRSVEAHLEHVRTLCDDIEFVYDSALTGYAAEMSDTVLRQIKAMPEVEAVEPNHAVTTAVVQADAPWGLGRISSPRKLSGTDSQAFPYIHDPSGGKGVDVYVLDSGIFAHDDFQGRVAFGANFVAGAPNTDEAGHGTHVAGIIGSRTYGVAKAVHMIAVKIIDGEGSGNAARTLAAINWTVKNKNKARGCVVNLSITGLRSTLVNNALRVAFDAGCLVVGAAGNNGDDACAYSPASEPTVLAVGSSSFEDSREAGSNYGKCIALFAPGVKIRSLTNRQNGTAVESGTSLAAAHVSGLAAYLMTKTNNFRPKDITNLILKIATTNARSASDLTSPNLLISNNGYQN